MLALVQLNRNRATRADKRPQLADLRESGDLENTADSVLGLYREEMDNPTTNEKKLAELSVLRVLMDHGPGPGSSRRPRPAS